ncbi:ATP-binding cassette domain-containing protein [Altererythrobacter sp. SALINAS58]|uniref:ATP-binding cassette domain-containing protein n=1 Tax=Alteripontixanthobacter muriae TaxID=2705546 RepID=UPI001576BF84|nr:ATP-binding cassette domain-containing protein [Alteripontixanthobacter muriae]NTZ41767.1 ATP-binding cassette domain-containing protein [Alteripontixanthobacter muriae]
MPSDLAFDIDCRLRVGDGTRDYQIKSGAVLTSLVGPSGVGKTSLLNCIAGLARAQSGYATVAGQRLFDTSAGQYLPPEARGAGYVFQDARLFPHLRVSANLAYGSKRKQHIGEPHPINPQAIMALLGIDHLLDRWPATLSGGEIRRVAIGRALFARPSFLLLDEPLVSLDQARADEMAGLIADLRDELRLPILHVSHDRAEVERLAGEVIEIA